MKYQFLDFIADTQSCVLTQNGKEIQIKTQAFEILTLLLKHSDRIVYKEEILKEVWAGRTVSPSSIDTRMKSLRKILGDNGKDQKIIKTFRHRGYKFLADVIKLSSEDCERPPRLHINSDKTSSLKNLTTPMALMALGMVWIAALLLFKISPNFNNTSAHNGTSIAVIVRTDECQGNKAQIISNRMINRLTRFKDGRVISNDSAQVTGLKNLSTREIGDLLAVNYLLSLDCTPYEKDLEELNINIFNSLDGQVLWGESFFSNQSSSSLSGVDSRIVTKSIQKISDLTGLSNATIVPDPSQHEAKVYWEKAIAWTETNDKEALYKAIEALEKLVVIEPDFGPAYAKLVSTYRDASNFAGMPHVQSKEKREHFLKLGLSIDPNNLDLNLEKARNHAHHGEYDNALARLDFVLDNNPNSVDALLSKAKLYHILRRKLVAEEHYKRAMLFDPLSAEILANYTHLQIDLGKYDEAYDMARKNVKWNPDSASAYQMLGQVYAEKGDYLNGFIYLEKSLILNPDHYRGQNTIAIMFACLGHAENSLKYITDDDTLAIALGFSGKKDELKMRYPIPSISSDVAYAYYLIGEPRPFINMMKPYFHEMGFNDEHKGVSRIDAHFMAGLTLLLKDEDSSIDVELIKRKLSQLHQKHPLSADSRQEDYLGLIAAEILNEDYDKALDVFEAALDAGIMLRVVENFSDYDVMTQTPRYMALESRMIEESNMEIAKIEAYLEQRDN